MWRCHIRRQACLISTLLNNLLKQRLLLINSSRFLWYHRAKGQAKQVWTRLRGRFRNLPFLGKKTRWHSLKWKPAGPPKLSETPIYKKAPWQNQTQLQDQYLINFHGICAQNFCGIVTYVGKHVWFQRCWTICSSKGCSWLTLVDFYGIIARKGRPLWLKFSKTNRTFHMQCHYSKGHLQHRARNLALPNLQLSKITKQVWTRLRGRFRNLPFLGKKTRWHSLKWKPAGPPKLSETPIYKKAPWQNHTRLQDQYLINFHGICAQNFCGIVTYVGKHVWFQRCSSKGCSWLTLVDFYGIIARKGRPLWLKFSKTNRTFHMQCHHSKGRLQHRARNLALPNLQLSKITKQVWTRLRGRFRNLPFYV